MDENPEADAPERQPASVYSTGKLLLGALLALAFLFLLLGNVGFALILVATGAALYGLICYLAPIASGRSATESGHWVAF